ncbi:hypothetical protein BV22DRAFT_380696 [Leucogyrophana mollusca]|uniref:Uncharacterized protein n=1 Tax=Leucogyrophana mollusca TaxID=85980 RepID=A0ACB8BLM1_9AGAM|nr:hypothetical protein BV22DRAFT_380696 [Leucogyrophana mollusca]
MCPPGLPKACFDLIEYKDKKLSGEGYRSKWETETDERNPGKGDDLYTKAIKEHLSDVIGIGNVTLSPIVEWIKRYVCIVRHGPAVT